MMSTDSYPTTKVATSRIVVGVALAVAAAIGVSALTVSAKHESQVAQTHVATPLGPDTQAPAPTADPNAVPAASTANAALGNGAMAPTVDATAMAQTASPPAASAVTKSDDSSTNARSTARAERRVASTHSPAAPASVDAIQSPPQPAPAPAQPAVSDVAPITQQASTSSGAESAPLGSTSDTQITAQVKSEVATAAPNSNVDVTTADGDVALAGSVPTQDAAEQAKQAAMHVAGVRHVDASGLTISNQ